jgi:hypothetical protein
LHVDFHDFFNLLFHRSAMSPTDAEASQDKTQEGLMVSCWQTIDVGMKK